MQPTEREGWLLNFYRNSELHGALLMGKLARTVRERTLLERVTEHCAVEAHHAALLTDVIGSLGTPLDPLLKPIQERYAAEGGVPTDLVGLLVLSETLEKRVLESYRAHLCRDDVHPKVRAALAQILHEMEDEEHGEHAGWIERELEKHPQSLVEPAIAKWRRVDENVAGELQREVDTRFALEMVRP